MTYATTAALASAGGAERATRQPALPLAFAAKAWYDFATCLRPRRMGRQQGAVQLVPTCDDGSARLPQH
jgi:hypothetical protein